MHEILQHTQPSEKERDGKGLKTEKMAKMHKDARLSFFCTQSRSTATSEGQQVVATAKENPRAYNVFCANCEHTTNMVRSSEVDKDEEAAHPLLQRLKVSGKQQFTSPEVHFFIWCLGCRDQKDVYQVPKGNQWS